MNSEDKKFIIVGTSGSHDFLKDTTGDLRFWPVRAPSASPAPPLSPEDRAIVNRLVAMTPDADGACDGIHDEDAPPQYLCTRCFPTGVAGGDLATHEDDVYDEVRRDDEQEME